VKRYKRLVMKLRDDLVSRSLGQEYVVVEPSQGVVDLSNVYTLNKTSALLWKTLQGKTFDEYAVTDILLEHYEVTKEQASHDARLLVVEFERLGLLSNS